MRNPTATNLYRVMAVAMTLALLPAAMAAGMAQEVKITHGPILGRVSSDGVGVWARTSRAGKFVVRYGTADRILTETSEPVETTLEHDYTGWVHLRGLKPNTKYYYAVVAVNDGFRRAFPEREHSGFFRTMPDAKEYRDAKRNPKGLYNFRFEFACGNNQSIGHGAGPNPPAFATMTRELRDKVNFSILNGDWLYEDRRAFSPASWRKQVGISADAALPRSVQVAPTIVGVWENYKTYLDRGPNLAMYHRHVPTFFTFDDHEILNDVWGAGTPGLVDRRAVFRDIGVRAWYDYLGWSNPVGFKQGVHFGQAALKAGSDVLEDPAADFSKLDLAQAATLHVHWGGPTAGVNDNALDDKPPVEPNAGVYEIVEVLDKHRLKINPPAKAGGKDVSYSIGRRSYWKTRIANCEFFVCDTRTHREMHDTKQPDKPGISMLGPAQRQWLMDGMKSSDADFLFVVSSVNFMVPHVGGGAVRTTNKDDAWTVFFDEREKLIKFWDTLGKRVLVLTGDLHNSFVIKITDNVWEFASGPHNSNNHWYTDEGNRPATGRFKYGPRACDIRWSTWFSDDIPRDQLQHPGYCVVQVNNVFNNPLDVGDERWIAYERPQVIFQYHDGRTGDLRYAEAIPAVR